MSSEGNMKANGLIDGGGAGTAAVFSLAMLVFVGFGYNGVATLLGGLLFPDQASGSLVREGERIVGSGLVAQPFADAKYFVPRPSAAGYNPMSAAGSNWAPGNPALRERVAADSAAVAAREGVAATSIPPDLVTASGSGLDPHITPASAELQVARIARARGVSAGWVREVVAAHTEAPTFGVLGGERVNVLLLNRALDAQGTSR